MTIPGLRGVEHIGFTVPNLEEATDFFVTHMGCEVLYSLGPYQHDDSNWMQEQLNVHPRTVVRKLNFLRCGHGSNFEIFEYEAADGQNPQPRNSDIGGHHLAFYVDDFEAAYEYLKTVPGVNLLGKPVDSSNASAGQRWIYFLTPWGMQCELVSFPNGKAYEQTTDKRLWHPANPAA